MPIQITMPALSPTMTEGNLAKWLKKEGDTVEIGDVIAEVETDKATMEVEAVDEGKMAKILVPEGTEGVAVNAPIAVLLGEDEDESALEGFESGAAAADGGKTKPAEAEPKEEPAPAKAETAPAPEPKEEPKAEPAPAPKRSGDERIFASPLAKRMAEQAGLDLATVTGSGPHGRIVKADIEAAMSGGQATAAPAAASMAMPSAPAAEPTAPYEEIPNSNMRKVIARRLLEAKQTIPHFYLTVDCNIDALLAMRKELNSREGADYKLSVNDFVIRATALALRKVPSANATWTDKATLRYNTVDVSVAVAVDNGLVTPVVRNADQKGLSAISAEMRDFATRARDGKLKPEEYQGGT
ncbi:MAG: pyruvate dehydrogenase complex dihydrolipoamide acetyltransferase, partial [Rhodospirillaceae bacterium]|nr:pyruvate dehydrogenase complex dihydrolipoamide acetyltransferase [Rhodospirillaceae bacterium]